VENSVRYCGCLSEQGGVHQNISWVNVGEKLQCGQVDKVARLEKIHGFLVQKRRFIFPVKCNHCRMYSCGFKHF